MRARQQSQATGKETGALYVVATPIGNLSDLSARAVQILREVDLIAAEDTRRVAKLLVRWGIDRPTTSFHSYSSPQKLQKLTERLKQGADVALVSDAGTPCVSDPGCELVAAAWEVGARIVPIPGPCAAVAAVSVSGFASGRFLFAGYLPRRCSERRQFLARLVRSPWPVVIYEAPGRVASVLADLVLVAGEDRLVMLGRELTKIHEELLRGPAQQVAAAWEAGKARGEVTIVVASGEETPLEGAVKANDLAQWLAQEGLTTGRIAAALSRLCAMERARAYELARTARRAHGYQS